MVYIVRYAFKVLEDLFGEHMDPRTSHWPLLGSPVPVLSCVTLYLLFVLHYGPKWMEKREAFSLRKTMIVYNAIQVVVNAYLLYIGTPIMFHPGYSLICQPVEPHNNEPWMQTLLLLCYTYYMTKYLDLFDTIFFVLRKKNNQITFLHVYHHAGMAIGVYIYATFIPGSHSTMLGMVNVFVHMVMYGYYLVTSLGSIKENFWWKKHITQLQLLQFGYLMLHFMLPLVRNTCQHPTIVSFIGLTQNMFMFVLFFDFYYKSYLRKSNPASKQIPRTAGNAQIAVKETKSN